MKAAPERNCAFCGKTFRARGQSERFCSRGCRQRYMRALKEAYGKKATAREGEALLPRACRVCGRIFQPGHWSQLACAGECTDKHIKLRIAEGKKTPLPAALHSQAARSGDDLEYLNCRLEKALADIVELRKCQDKDGEGRLGEGNFFDKKVPLPQTPSLQKIL